MADVGRPSKKTEEVVAKLEEIFALDGSVEEACFFANISRNAYYDWIKEDPKLNDRFESLRQTPFLKARRTLVEGLDKPEHAQWYMERKKRKEFGPKQEVELSGQVGLQSIEKQLKDLSNEPTTPENSEDGKDDVQGRDGQSDGIDPRTVGDISVDIQEALS